MKKLSIIIIVAVMATLLSGCGSTKLADSFDKDNVESASKQVVSYLNAADYDSVCSMLREDLQKVLPPEDLKSAVEKTYGNAGSFVDYKNVVIIGQKVKSTKEDSAMAIVVAKYENQNVTFTLSFDTDMKLIGIYMK